MKNVKQLNNKLSKLSEEQRTQIFKDVWSWKQLGGYELQNWKRDWTKRKRYSKK